MEEQVVNRDYPKWLFSADGSKKVKDSAEHHALGEGWFESPALVPKEEKKGKKADK